METLLTVHLEGVINDNSKLEGGIEIVPDGKSYGECVAIELADGLSKYAAGPSGTPHGLDDMDNADTYIPNVFIRIYATDLKCSLEAAEQSLIEQLSGSVDIHVGWLGYSEYTVTGYSVENFTIGGHDLENILKSLVGKYVHIVAEKKA